MDVDVLETNRCIDRVALRRPRTVGRFTNRSAILLEPAEVSSIAFVMRAAVEPVESFAREFGCPGLSSRGVHGSARSYRIGDPVGMLRIRLERRSRTVGPMKPTACLPVPHDLAKKTKAMLGRLAQFFVGGKIADQFSGSPRLPRLKFEELLLRATSLPVAAETAQKTSVLQIQTARKPNIDDVPPQCCLEVLRRQHLDISPQRQRDRKRRKRLTNRRTGLFLRSYSRLK